MDISAFKKEHQIFQDILVKYEQKETKKKFKTKSLMYSYNKYI